MGGVVAILFATAAAAAVFLYVQSAREKAEGARDMTEVIVSKVEIPANQDLDALIEQGVFQTKSVPTEDLIAGVLTDEYQLRGQRTAYPILVGEQISASRLQGELQARGGDLGIPPGMQAASVTLAPERAVGSRVSEGDHVEVYGTFRKTNSDAWVTQILVVDAEVLAVTGVSEDGATDRDSTVTLAVTPEDAQRLIYGQEQGRVWLTLLPPNEPGTVVKPVRSVNW
jgi:pilus assembly protein CpaB